jgi:predicted MFS family arabinose efflux permease
MGSALILAIINGLSVASLHYAQSLLPQIARDLQLTAGEVLLIPMAIHIGLAVSLLLLLPIGDGVDRRRMLVYLALAMAVACAAIGLLPSLPILLFAFFGLGSVALVPYLFTGLCIWTSS